MQREFTTFQAGAGDQTVAAALGPDRELRKTYEGYLADAQVLGENSIEAGEHSVATATARSMVILVGYLLAALAVGIGVASWIVRTIARPLFGLIELLGSHLS